MKSPANSLALHQQSPISSTDCSPRNCPPPNLCDLLVYNLHPGAFVLTILPFICNTSSAMAATKRKPPQTLFIPDIKQFRHSPDASLSPRSEKHSHEVGIKCTLLFLKALLPLNKCNNEYVRGLVIPNKPQ